MLRNYTEVGKRLWDVGDELGENSKPRSSESFFPVLGLTLLLNADQGTDRSRECAIQDLTPFVLYQLLLDCDA